MITKEERDKRVNQLINGKAICELGNTHGPSEFLKEEQRRYIDGEIESETLIRNVINHYKADKKSDE